MKTARRVFGTAQLLDGRVLVAGGRDDSSTLLDSTETYDPAARTWARSGSLPVAAVGVVLATLTDGRVLATGGGGPAPLTDSSLYTP